MAAQCPESFITVESSAPVNTNVKHLAVTPSAQGKGKKRAVSPALTQPLAQALTQASNSCKRRKVHPVSVTHTQVKPAQLTGFSFLFYTLSF